MSFSRALARASIRLARFAHAINNTSPVIPNSSHNEVSYFSRSELMPFEAGYAAN